MRRFFFILVLITLPSSARADCLSPAGLESQTRYDFATHKMYFCNGTDWQEGSADGRIGAVTSNKWCRGTGTQIVCDQNAPGGVADNLGDHTATASLNLNSNRIINLAAPIAAGDGTTKSYVDNKFGTLTNSNWCRTNGTQVICDQTAPSGGTDRVAKTGDTMTGALTLSGAPTAANHAATKTYVDDKYGTITNGKWCTGATGSKIQCTSDAPEAALTASNCTTTGQIGGGGNTTCPVGKYAAGLTGSVNSGNIRVICCDP